MSHDDHGHEQGGHEIDKMPNGRLFNLLGGLSALTLLSCIGVVQLFNLQVRGIEDERNSRVSYRLTEYREEQAKLRDSYGRVLIKEDDGLTKPEGDSVKVPRPVTLRRMPMADAIAKVVKDPKAFAAQRRYRGWVNPDAKAEEAAKAKAKAGKPQARPGRPGPGGAIKRPSPRGAVPARPAPRGAAPAPTGAKPGAAPVPAGAKPGAAPKPAGAKPGGAPKPAGAKPPANKPGGAPAPGAKPAPGGKPSAPPKPAGDKPAGDKPAGGN